MKRLVLLFASFCILGDQAFAPIALGQEQKDPTHTSIVGVMLQENCRSAGLKCELVYPGTPDVKSASAFDYLIARLKAPKR